MLARPAFALDEDEHSGLAADTLTIRVGYFGGPYYDKAAFTADELWNMDVVYADYTFIDNMPSVVINHVAGVTLADVMGAAGIDLNSVQSFNFWTNDKRGGYYTSLTKTFLIDTPRYCYYSLPDNFDYDAGAGNDYATLEGEWVPTVLALADDWNRAINGASFGSDYQNLNTNTRFRLVYGQTDARARTASSSAKWVHSIEVTLGGAPTIELDESVLDLEVGSKRRTEARVRAADAVIAENAVIEWSSSDESIASVDENGEITVHKEGSAVITARIGETAVRAVINGIAEQQDKTPDGAGAYGEPSDPPGEGETGIPGGVAIAGEAEMPDGIAVASEVSDTDAQQTMDQDADAAPEITDNADINADAAPESENVSELDSTEDAPEEADEPAEVTPEPVEPAVSDEQRSLDGQESVPIGATVIGHEITILGENETESGDGSGGVQNWRKNEMSLTAAELPIINEETPLAMTALSAVIVFIVGGVFRYIQYKLALEGNYVFRRNV